MTFIQALRITADCNGVPPVDVFMSRSDVLEIQQQASPIGGNQEQATDHPFFDGGDDSSSDENLIISNISRY